MTTKKCAKCSEVKHVDEFPIQQRGRKTDTVKKTTTRRSECRTCYNAYMREYLKNGKHKDRVKAGKKGKVQKTQKIKLQQGCSKCGYNKCAAALHFHHRDPDDKLFDVSWAARYGRKWDDINREIMKCDILCANCHAEEEEAKLHQ